VPYIAALAAFSITRATGLEPATTGSTVRYSNQLSYAPKVARSETYSTPARAGDKPSKPNKPSPEFPLFPHAAGVWAKKIRGKMHYFGPWNDWKAALDNYDKQKDALHAGRKPRTESEGTTVKEMCNQFMADKQALVDSGELTQRSWDDYKAACVLIIKHFGNGRLIEDIGPDDFASLRKKMAKKWGPTTLRNVIQRIRVVFKYAVDNGLTDRVIRYGQGFKRPSQKVLRLHRAEQGPKLFTASEVRRLIGAAGVQLRAMILLGINCGFGNADCGHLRLSSLDLDKGIIDFPRPKTGIPRRCVLWSETVQAVQDALAKRPTPKSEENAVLVFITKYGLPWAKDSTDQTLAKEFGKLLRSLRINGRKGLGFYTLRHTFRTIADEVKDQPAVDYCMGHEVPHMSAVYRETISDARLRAVADHVRRWLFPSIAFVKPADVEAESADRL
jgi:integrase